MDVWLKQHPKDVYAALQNAVSFKSPRSNLRGFFAKKKTNIRTYKLHYWHVWFGAEI